MRKPRDFDSELKALADKSKALKERRVRQLGELVTATGADTLDADLLAGVLLDASAMKDAATKEGWRKRGAAFFQSKARKSAPRSAPCGEHSTARRRLGIGIGIGIGIGLRHRGREPTCENGWSSDASERAI